MIPLEEHEAAPVKLGTATEVYDRYTLLSQALTEPERYRHAIRDADPDVDLDYAFHLAHNWGNPAAKALLERYNRRSSQLSERKTREYRKAEHREGRCPPARCPTCRRAWEARDAAKPELTFRQSACGYLGCPDPATEPDPYGGDPVCKRHYRQLMDEQIAHAKEAR